ncbi:hypothetical protein [Leadbettera azotonutricia]|uniref:Uncharacterized protein n=1 Tax=Leadbettera azotonutricia (strain ATCC BAA-888 / DSM 13862 / ZAS-9) TaxID=545695 RepID=F5YFN4_LEAAZ|nr:hypothetical protein [Leadbettera azotonutricia]AEF80652.1 hypothetical protein TREAZ_2486 [Leadbettera azotonutricia ZAS-9]
MNLEYRTETEDDIADLAGCVLRARDITTMAERNAQDPDSYFEVMAAFELIRVLLEPVGRFLCNEAVGLVKAAEHKKARKGKRTAKFLLEAKEAPMK